MKMLINGEKLMRVKTFGELSSAYEVHPPLINKRKKHLKEQLYY
jgi:hypothetical protein